jgi:fructose/tagatose bisphosphate aldolase
VGNIHGAVSEATKNQKKIQARLALDRLAKLWECTRVPLVLHGGSGIRQEDVLAAMGMGIAKINVGTEIRQAYEQALKDRGSVTAAQDALYDRTVVLVRDWFRLSGIRQRILA